MKTHTPIPKSPRRTGLCRTGFYMLLPVIGSVAFAQNTPAKPAATTEENSEIVKLSAFTVSTDKDSGYRASNSIAGTRTNTPIKDVPLNIQVFTKDLSDDLLIADQTQFERYNAALVNGGADVQSEINIQQAYNNFLFRGFVQNWGLRDGVREYDPVDAQGLARVELVKGPAAALYGLSYAGGVMNNITKQVDMRRNFGSVRLTAYGEGGYRATVDANYTGNAANGKFGVRFNAASSNIEDKREHSEGSTHFYQTNLEFQPWKDTSLALLVENGWRQKPIGLGYYTRSGGATANAGKAASETGIGVVVPLQADHPEIPWTWNWANGDNNRTLKTNLVRGTITQAIGENFTVNAYLQTNGHQNVDSNGWDDNNNSQNPAGWDVASWSEFGVAPNGWLNAGTNNEIIRKVYHWRDWSNSVHSMGINAVYKFDVSSIKNTLTFGGASWEERFWTNKWLQPSTTTTFFDMAVRSGVSTTPPPGNAPNDFRHNTNEGGREHNKNSYYYASWQLAAFENRLKLNAAINRTSINNTSWGTISTLVANTPAVDVSKTSPMFGGMFDITREISVFAVHSTSLFPTTDKNDFNVQMPPEVGKGNEAGVKIDLLEGKISGTVSYYQIKKTGGGVRDPNANNRNKLIWDTLTTGQRISRGWDPTNRNAITTGDGFSGSLGDLVPAELESKGYEADVVYQATRSLQMVFSYAHNTAESLKGETKGDTISGHIKDQLAILAKYSILEGAAKGLSFGLGFQHAGKAYQEYLKDAAGNKISRYNPSTKYVELFAGYKFKAFGFDQVVQFNAKNLTEQDDFIGWKPTRAGTVATERYAVPTYARFSLTWGLDF